ncbi:MAG: PIN domain-containing protein [Thermoanaerobaculia bacterium]
MLNVDTHVLIDAMAGSLPAREERLLRSETWSISAIVLWELAKLAQLGRIELDLDDADVEHFLAQIHVWPISLEVVRAMTQLDFRSDPADELIAATSVVHRVPLLTRDRKLLKSKVVPLARR